MLSWRKKRATFMHTKLPIFNPHLLKQWSPVGGTTWVLLWGGGYGRQAGVGHYWTEHQNQRYRQCGAEQFSISVSTAGTPVSLTLGFPPGHGKEGWKRKEVYYGWSLLFQRADERSTKFHCKGMHFKGEFKTSKILSALTTKLKRRSSRIILCIYYCNI